MSETMKMIVVLEDKSVAVHDISMPQINDCQALVKNIACGICGSDIKIIHRELEDKGIGPYPLMLGHEAIGEVVKVGSRVKSFKPGDIVFMPSNARPRDGYGSAWGGFGEYGIVNDGYNWDIGAYGPVPPAAFCQRVLPKTIDPVDAVMIITLREVCGAIKRFGISPNESTVIFGCGPVGLAFIRLMYLLGVYPIVALDIVDDKLEEAKRMGATHVFNSKDGTYQQKIRELFPNGVRNVIDAIGNTNVINWAMTLIEDFGNICVYGVPANTDMHLDWTKAPDNWNIKNQQLISKVDEAATHNQVMAWVESGALNLKDFISDVFDFADYKTAFEKFEKREIAKKGIIRYR